MIEVFLWSCVCIIVFVAVLFLIRFIVRVIKDAINLWEDDL